MDKLGVTLMLFWSIIFYGMERVSGEVEEKKVQPGDNITLECNSETETKLIEWHRNCTHLNQPTFPIPPGRYAPPRFSITTSTKSSVLRIENITEGDLGLYYCTGSVQTGGSPKRELIGKTFKVIFEDILPSPEPSSCPPPECRVCWTLLVSLCPTVSLLSAFISSTCVYYVLRKKVGPKKTEPHQEPTHRRTNRKQDEDLCYASLDMPANRHMSTAKKKRQQKTDFSTYSAVRTTSK